MKVSYNWLREFVDFDESPEQIAEILTQLAFDLEEMRPVRRHLHGIGTGRIVEVQPHPKSDKLVVAHVDVGGETLDMVCGAPNCREGLIVATALPGTKIGDLTVEGRKIKGVKSDGIILSERELGITDDHTGILELDPETGVGTSLETLLEPEDFIFDFEVTVNRPDAMSHLGMARELAAYFRKPLRFPPFELDEADRETAEKVRVEIVAPKEGPRYVARLVEGIEVGPSPLWMRALLFSLGQRPINNIVDITNYVLFELGHPLHAFDYHLLKDGHIIVRLAVDGEEFTTLDDQKRILKQTDLLIADPEKAIALAGVMGGKNSEVHESTTDILVEAAYFDPVTIRQTSKHLGLATEASRRFERGADPSMPAFAAARCAKLISELAGGEILKGDVDAYPVRVETRKIMVRPSRTSAVLGLDVSTGQVSEALESLQLEVKSIEEDLLEVTIPTFRPDLEREIDLVEEVARIAGYQNIPSATVSKVALDSPDSPLEDLVDAAIDTMVGLGFREAVSTAMVSGSDQVLFNPDCVPLSIEKPINPEMNVYRASLVPSLLRALQRNVKQGIESIRLFETGQTGGKGWLAEDEGQRIHLAFVACGASPAAAFDRPSQMIDLYDLKTIIMDLAEGISLDNSSGFSYYTPENLDLGFTLRDEDGSTVLICGRLHPEITSAFDLEVDVYVAEVDLERWGKPVESGVKRPGAIRNYKTFSRFPASSRDIAFIVPKNIAAADIEDRISKTGGELLEELFLFDLYEGKPLEQNERSLAFRLAFRAEDRTLTDDEVDPLVEKIVESVQSLRGVRHRAQ